MMKKLEGDRRINATLWRKIEDNSSTMAKVLSSISFYLLLTTSISFLSCRDDVMVVPMEDINTGGKTVKSEIIGMYLLNEGPK